MPAAFLVLAVACGGTGSERSDGGAPDAGPEVGGDGDASGETAAGDASPGPKHECDGFAYDTEHLVPGPCEEGWDAELAAKALRYERSFHVFSAAAMGVNSDLSVPVDRTADREAIEAFVQAETGWDFVVSQDRHPMDVVAAVHKATGMYAGAGIVADAYRYAVLRDQGYPPEEVERAREWLAKDLEVLHVVVDVTGEPGIIARSIAHKGFPGDGQFETLPLFDAGGNPIPEPKNNGTWRDDRSGRYPDLIWEDSISRDMLAGWAMAYGAAWEVVRDDPAFDPDRKATMQADAKALGESLRKVAPSGYDLEIPDADGRRTLHGCLHEHNFDCAFYEDSLENGFHALMALGIVAAWVFVSEDEALASWLRDELVGERRLHEIARDGMIGVDLGTKTNYSNVNMAMMTAWMASRYLDDPDARPVLEAAIRDAVYDVPGQPNQPADLAQSFFDFVYAAALTGQSAATPPSAPVDQEAVDRGVETLRQFPDAPYWSFGKVNCPEAVCTCDDTSVDSPDCTALDGSALTVLGCVGRNCDLITEELVPMAIRGPSNYHWRSNPYQPNRDGDGGMLLPGVDFRVAYWIGRYARR